MNTKLISKRILIALPAKFKKPVKNVLDWNFNWNHFLVYNLANQILLELKYDKNGFNNLNFYLKQCVYFIINSYELQSTSNQVLEIKTFLEKKFLYKKKWIFNLEDQFSSKLWNFSFISTDAYSAINKIANGYYYFYKDHFDEGIALLVSTLIIYVFLCKLINQKKIFNQKDALVMYNKLINNNQLKVELKITENKILLELINILKELKLKNFNNYLVLICKCVKR